MRAPRQCAATVAALASDDHEAFIDEYIRLTLFGALSDEGRASAKPALEAEQHSAKKGVPLRRRIGDTGGPNAAVRVGNREKLA